MQLHTLPSIKKTSKKRLGLGHGSGRGKTSGRGTKGQKARNKVAIMFEGGGVPLIKRMPFRRGKLRNISLRENPIVINVSDLASFPSKTVVDVDSLITAKMIPAEAKKIGVKLLGNGTVEHAYTVKIAASKVASEKIVKAGGSIESTN